MPSPPRRRPRSPSRTASPGSMSWSKPPRVAGTAIGGSRWASDRDQLAVLAPGDPQPVADLADRGVGPDRLEDQRHEVAVAPRGRLEAVHGRRPGRRRTVGPDTPDALDLAALAVGIDPVEGRGMDVVVAEAVDADHDLVAGLDRPLDAVGGLLDLALLEAAFDRRE